MRKSCSGGEEGRTRVAGDVLQADVVRLSLAVHSRIHHSTDRRLALQLHAGHPQVCLRLRRRDVVGRYQGNGPKLHVQYGSWYISCYLVEQF